jgi:hypothetical protein
MTPRPADDRFAFEPLQQAAAARFPGLAVVEPIGRSLKALLLRGLLGGAPVTVKKLVDDRPLWRWYFEREVTLLEGFVTGPPPVAFPRLIDADRAGGWLLVEYLPGPPLASRRWADGQLDPALVRALVEAQQRLAAWPDGLRLAPSSAPPPAVAQEIRSRLLEDPSAPLAWCTDGIILGNHIGIIPAEPAALAVAALVRHPRVVFAHGDLLLRNVLADGPADSAGVALIDWECAGAHPEGWDLAILWANLLPSQRAPIDTLVARWTPPARAAFHACALFAITRELKFRGAHLRPRPRDAREAQLRADLADRGRSLGAMA